jgi:hypothetical protein
MILPGLLYVHVTQNVVGRNLLKSSNLGDQERDGKITLSWILKKLVMKMGNEFDWLQTCLTVGFGISSAILHILLPLNWLQSIPQWKEEMYRNC